jgi:hypothetical protein
MFNSYGLRGFEIIMKELKLMFPSVPDCAFGGIKLPIGLSWNNFIEFVLVPEVVGIIISEDMNVTLEEAFMIRQKSSKFGISVFPDVE